MSSSQSSFRLEAIFNSWICSKSEIIFAEAAFQVSSQSSFRLEAIFNSWICSKSEIIFAETATLNFTFSHIGLFHNVLISSHSSFQLCARNFVLYLSPQIMIHSMFFTLIVPRQLGFSVHVRINHSIFYIL